MTGGGIAKSLNGHKKRCQQAVSKLCSRYGYEGRSENQLFREGWLLKPHDCLGSRNFRLVGAKGQVIRRN
jgi:hypothetical protein